MQLLAKRFQVPVFKVNIIYIKSGVRRKSGSTFIEAFIQNSLGAVAAELLQMKTLS